MDAIKRFRDSGQRAYSYIGANPGCCIADVDRACRTARAGHRWMYASVGRLVKAGLVRRERGERGAWRLFVSEDS